MIKMRREARSALLAFALAAAGSSAPGAVAGAGIAAKPWDLQNYCDWWLSNDDGKSLRASIGQGDGELVLTLADPVFLRWPEEDRPRVELRFDRDPQRRFETEGWSSHVGNETALFGMMLDAEARRVLAGATMLELRRDGVLIFELPLIATPGQAELEACIPPPGDGHSDSE